MRKGVNLVRKLFVVMLTVMLTLSMAAIPSFADDITITIKNNEGLPKMDDGQYQTFQIFSGTPGTMAAGGNSQELIDIEWGDGVNPVKVVEVLKASELTNSKGEKVFESISSITADSTDAEKEASAREVAAILAAKDNAENSFLQDFASVIADPVNGCIVAEKVQKSTAVHPVKDDPASDYSTIQVPSTGYYLIEQVTKTGVDFVTSFILRVITTDVAKNTVNLKADIPTFGKEIIEGETSKTTDVAGIGDLITFKLTGDLPENYADYEKYTYKFTDTLSKGLSYAGPMEIRVGDYTLTEEDLSKLNIPKIENDTPSSGETTITIDLGDLKRADAPWKDAGLAAKTKITVTYKARVTEAAVIGGNGNPNTATLEYSNNPNADTTGKTPESKVYVYTFALEINKVDETTTQPLGGAVFAVSKKVTVDDTEKTYYYSVDAGTVTWIDRADISELPDTAKFKTDNAGKLTINGLDVGTYTVTEIEAPTDYSKILPFEVTIEAEVNDVGVKTFSVSFTGTTQVDQSKADPKTGVASLRVKDPQAPFLPFTGGAGTVIFYVVGAALVIGAVVLLVIANRKKQ